MATKSTIFFEQGTGKFVQTFKTRPEWISTFVRKNKLVNTAMTARAKNDEETLRKTMRSIRTVNRKMQKEGIFCEFVCQGKLKV